MKVMYLGNYSRKQQWEKTGGKPVVDTHQASYHCGQLEFNPASKLKINLEYASELTPQETEPGMFILQLQLSLSGAHS